MSFSNYIKEKTEDHSNKNFVAINMEREGKPVMLTSGKELENTTVLSCTKNALTYIHVEHDIASIEQIILTPPREVTLRLDVNKLKNNVKHIK
jgi:hypothetical protein